MLRQLSRVVAAPRSFTALTAATRPLAAGAPLRLGAVRPLSASGGASSSSDAPTTDAPTEEVIWQLRNLVQMMPAPLVAAYSRDNMSQPQLNQLGVQAMITKWQRFPGDTGSSEVQIAVATERIASSRHAVASSNEGSRAAERACGCRGQRMSRSGLESSLSSRG